MLVIKSASRWEGATKKIQMNFGFFSDDVVLKNWKEEERLKIEPYKVNYHGSCSAEGASEKVNFYDYSHWSQVFQVWKQEEGHSGRHEELVCVLKFT